MFRAPGLGVPKQLSGSSVAAMLRNTAKQIVTSLSDIILSGDRRDGGSTMATLAAAAMHRMHACMVQYYSCS